MQYRLFQGIRKLKKLRETYPVFLNAASVRTVETYDPALLCLVREFEGERLTAVFNFSGEEKTAWISEPGTGTDLLSGETLEVKNVPMRPFGARWMFCKEA